MGLTIAMGIGATAAGASETASTVSATFRCTAVDVTSTKHDLSNVVLRFEGGDQKFEGLRGTTGTFSGTGAFADKPIKAVFVKAGNNKSTEGPGYGEQIVPSTDTCGQSGQAGASNTGGSNTGGSNETPDPAKESKGDSAVVGATFSCDNKTVDVTSTKDISNVVLLLSDGREIKFDGLSGTSKTFTAPAGTTIVAVWIKSGSNASGDGPGYGEKVMASGAGCFTGGSTNTNTNTGGSNNTNTGNTNTGAVLGTTEVNEVAATLGTPANGTKAAVGGLEAERPRGAQVLGVTLERPARVASAGAARTAPATLAATGFALDLSSLLLASGGLLTGGTVLVRRSRRNPRSRR